MNEYQEARFAANMVASMFNTVAGKRIALFGAAFKANTNDTRESPALEVCRGIVGRTSRYRDYRSACHGKCAHGSRRAGKTRNL